MNAGQNLSGRTLGSFELHEMIGSGGMGAVYRAYQSSMKRDVAIKVLPPSLALSPDYLERFNRESEIIARLEHPHIVPVYEYGTDQGFTYVAMRLVGGGSLAKRIRRYGMPSLGETRDLYQQLASALDYAHRQNVIHRDVKPGNVLIDGEGNAYLADFGIAKLVGSTVLTQGVGIGTAAYMAPELARGEAYDGRVDVYALGVMLFGLLTGYPPYQAESNDALIYQHIHEPIPSPRQYNPALPESLDRVIFRAMAKMPEDRYATCKELADDLALAIADIPAELNPEARTDFFTMPLPPSPVPAERRALGGAVSPPLPAAVQRSRIGCVGWIVSLLLVAVAAFVGFWVFIDHDSSDNGKPISAIAAADTVVAELASQTAAASTLTPSPSATITPDATLTVQAIVDLRFTQTARAATPDLVATAESAGSAPSDPVAIVDQVVRFLYERPGEDEPAAEVSHIRLPITGISEDEKFYRVRYEERDLWLEISPTLKTEGDLDDLEVIVPS